jgi:hypothetical protein
MADIARLAEKSEQLANGETRDRDPFADLDTFRLAEGEGDSLATGKLITSILINKPNKQEFIRVHPDEEYRGAFRVLELRSEREHYLIPKQLQAALEEESSPVLLYTAITRQGTPFLWPIKLPGADGRVNSWTASAQICAQTAMTQWIRVKANTQAGGYDCTMALGAIPEPTWPTLSFREILSIAFRGKVIESFDHPVLKVLRGEV